MPVDIKHLSYSSVQTFLLCPRSWRYRYVDRIQTPQAAALAFGSAFHSVVEDAVRARTSQGKTNLGDLWLSKWGSLAESLPGEIDWGDSSFERLRDDGLRMLANTETDKVVSELVPLVDGKGPWVERYVELHVPDVPLPVIGYIDLVDVGGVPHDLKTAARAWDQRKADEEIQPVFYLAALNQAGFPLNKSLLFKYVIFVKPTKTRPNGITQVLTSTRSIGDLFRLFGTIQDVWRGIEAGSYPCNTNTWKCSSKYCEHFQTCQGRK